MTSSLDNSKISAEEGNFQAAKGSKLDINKNEVRLDSKQSPIFSDAGEARMINVSRIPENDDNDESSSYRGSKDRNEGGVVEEIIGTQGGLIDVNQGTSWGSGTAPSTGSQLPFTASIPTSSDSSVKGIPPRREPSFPSSTSVPFPSEPSSDIPRVSSAPENKRDLLLRINREEDNGNEDDGRDPNNTTFAAEVEGKNGIDDNNSSKKRKKKTSRSIRFNYDNALKRPHTESGKDHLLRKIHLFNHLLIAHKKRRSIKKSVAFNTMRTTDISFLAACTEMSLKDRNWNGEFQALWESSVVLYESAVTRYQRLLSFMNDFEIHCRGLVRSIVEEDDDGPARIIHRRHCVRYGNVFFRVMPDLRSARNYVSTLRSLLSVYLVTPGITVPLTMLFTHRGVPVLAQGLFGLPKDYKTRLRYGKEKNVTFRTISDGSFNHTSKKDKPYQNQNFSLKQFNDDTAFLFKQICAALGVDGDDAEIYESLDGRRYCTTAHFAEIPLFKDEAHILKRNEFFLHGHYRAGKKNNDNKLVDGYKEGPEGVINIARSEALIAELIMVAEDVMRSSSASESTIEDEIRAQLTIDAVIHQNGVNMCLIKYVLTKLQERSDEFDESLGKELRQRIAVEILARTAKDQFYLESQSKHVAFDGERANSMLSRTLESVFKDQVNFCRKFLVNIAKKFGVEPDDSECVEDICIARNNRQELIVHRICESIGATLVAGDKSCVIWTPVTRWNVLPPTANPEYVLQRFEVTRLARNLPLSISDNDNNSNIDTVSIKNDVAFNWPLLARIHGWRKEFENGSYVINRVYSVHKEQNGPYALSTLHAKRESATLNLLNGSPEAIVDGVKEYEELIYAHEESGRQSKANRNDDMLEYGDWILWAGLNASIPEKKDCIDKSVELFNKSTQFLTERDIENPLHGNWVLLKPYNSLLSADEAYESCSITPSLVDLKGIIQPSMRIVEKGWLLDSSIHYVHRLISRIKDKDNIIMSKELIFGLDLLKKAKIAVNDDIYNNLEHIEPKKGVDQFLNPDNEDSSDEIKKKQKQIEHAPFDFEKNDLLKKVFPFLEKEFSDILSYLSDLIDDPYFILLARRYAALLDKNDPVYNGKINKVKRQMGDRARQLGESVKKAKAKQDRAKEVLEEKYPFIQVPPSTTLAALNPESDRKFRDLSTKRAGLLTNPLKNANAIKATEDEMNKRVATLAGDDSTIDDVILSTFPFLEKEPSGVNLCELGLENDKPFNELAESRRNLLKKPRHDAKALENIESEMKDRANELAKAKKRRRRRALARDDDIHSEMPYLAEDPDGVPLNEMHLKSDPEFDKLLRKPGTEAERDQHAHALASQRNEADNKLLEMFPFLSEKISGVPISEAQLGSDPTFASEAAKYNQLKSNPSENMNAINEAEKKLSAFANELAAKEAAVRAALDARDDAIEARYPFLDSEPEGVPLRQLPLRRDADFQNLDKQRLELLEKPTLDDNAVKNLERRMNDRAHDLAKQKKSADDAILDQLPNLDPFPLGLPIGDLHLENDPVIQQLLDEHLQLKNDPRASPDAIAALEQKIDDYVQDLAAQTRDNLAKEALPGSISNQYPFLDLDPEGASLEQLGLESDPLFSKLASDRQALIADDPVAHDEEIKGIEKAMNDRAHEVAKKKLDESFLPFCKFIDSPLLVSTNRNYILPSEIQQQPCNVIIPENNEIFKDCKMFQVEDNLNPLENSAKVLDINCQVEKNDLLATSSNKNNFSFTPDCLPEYILDDYYFCHLSDRRGALIRKHNPNFNGEILRLGRQISDRVEQLKKSMKKSKEKQSRVKQQLSEAYESFLNCPSQTTFVELNPEADGIFRDLAKKRLQLISNCPDKLVSSTKKDIEDQMNERIEQIAIDSSNENDSFVKKYSFLENKLIEGIKLSELNLNNDKPFMKLAASHNALLKSFCHNPDIVKDLEFLMYERVNKLAKAKKRRRRRALAKDDDIHSEMPYLAEDPDGVPLNEMHLKSVPEFDKLLRKPGTEAERDQHAHALAGQRNEADNKLLEMFPFLSEKISGVPISEAQLGSDPTFASEAAKYNQLKSNPSRNMNAIKEAEKKLSALAKELAAKEAAVRAALDARDDVIEARYPFLDPEPEGVPLRLLNLQNDDAFSEISRMRFSMLENPNANEPFILALEKRLNELAKELALRKKASDEAIIAQLPDIRLLLTPLSLNDLELEKDSVFRDCFTRLINLKKSPKKNATEIDALHLKLIDCVKNAIEETRENLSNEPIDLRNFLIIFNNQDFSESIAFNSLSRSSLSLEASPDEDVKEFCEKYPFLRDFVFSFILEDLLDDLYFSRLSVRHEALKKRGDMRNEGEIRRLERQMIDRVKQLVLSVKKAKGKRDRFNDLFEKKYPFFDKNITSFFLSLNPESDGRFRKLSSKREKMLSNSVTCAEELNGVEEEMKRIADIIYEEFTQRKVDIESKYPFFDKEIKGFALNELNLDSDKSFKKLAVDREILLENPRHDLESLKNLEYLMLDRANTFAKAKKRKRRRALAKDDDIHGEMPYLTEDPLGVPLNEMHLRNDFEYSDLLNKPGTEAERDQRSQAIANERNEADAKLVEMFPFLTEKMCGVPISEIYLLSDSKFKNLVNNFNELLLNAKKDPNSYQNSVNIVNDDSKMMIIEEEKAEIVEYVKHLAAKEAAVRAALDARDDELEARYPFLDPEPEGVPLRQLPIFADLPFLELNHTRISLMSDYGNNQYAILSVEDQLRERSGFLASKKKKADAFAYDQLRQFLSPNFFLFRIPFGDFQLGDDINFLNLIKKIRNNARYLVSPRFYEEGSNTTVSNEEVLNNKELSEQLFFYLARLQDLLINRFILESGNNVLLDDFNSVLTPVNDIISPPLSPYSRYHPRYSTNMDNPASPLDSAVVVENDNVKPSERRVYLPAQEEDHKKRGDENWDHYQYDGKKDGEFPINRDIINHYYHHRKEIAKESLTRSNERGLNESTGEVSIGESYHRGEKSEASAQNFDDYYLRVINDGPEGQSEGSTELVESIYKLKQLADKRAFFLYTSTFSKPEKNDAKGFKGEEEEDKGNALEGSDKKADENALKVTPVPSPSLLPDPAHPLALTPPSSNIIKAELGEENTVHEDTSASLLRGNIFKRIRTGVRNELILDNPLGVKKKDSVDKVDLANFTFYSEKYPFLYTNSEEVTIEDLPLEFDDEFLILAKEMDALTGSTGKNLRENRYGDKGIIKAGIIIIDEKIKEKERQMNTRVHQIERKFVKEWPKYVENVKTLIKGGSSTTTTTKTKASVASSSSSSTYSLETKEKGGNGTTVERNRSMRDGVKVSGGDLMTKGLSNEGTEELLITDKEGSSGVSLSLPMSPPSHHSPLLFDDDELLTWLIYCRAGAVRRYKEKVKFSDLVNFNPATETVMVNLTKSSLKEIELLNKQINDRIGYLRQRRDKTRAEAGEDLITGGGKEEEEEEGDLIRIKSRTESSHNLSSADTSSLKLIYSSGKEGVEVGADKENDKKVNNTFNDDDKTNGNDRDVRSEGGKSGTATAAGVMVDIKPPSSEFVDFKVDKIIKRSDKVLVISATDRDSPSEDPGVEKDDVSSPLVQETTSRREEFDRCALEISDIKTPGVAAEGGSFSSTSSEKKDKSKIDIALPGNVNKPFFEDKDDVNNNIINDNNTSKDQNEDSLTGSTTSSLIKTPTIIYPSSKVPNEYDTKVSVGGDGNNKAEGENSQKQSVKSKSSKTMLLKKNSIVLSNALSESLVSVFNYSATSKDQGSDINDEDLGKNNPLNIFNKRTDIMESRLPFLFSTENLLKVVGNVPITRLNLLDDSIFLDLLKNRQYLINEGNKMVECEAKDNLLPCPSKTSRNVDLIKKIEDKLCVRVQDIAREKAKNDEEILYQFSRFDDLFKGVHVWNLNLENDLIFKGYRKKHDELCNNCDFLFSNDVDNGKNCDISGDQIFKLEDEICNYLNEKAEMEWVKLFETSAAVHNLEEREKELAINVFPFLYNGNDKPNSGVNILPRISPIDVLMKSSKAFSSHFIPVLLRQLNLYSDLVFKKQVMKWCGQRILDFSHDKSDNNNGERGKTSSEPMSLIKRELIDRVKHLGSIKLEDAEEKILSQFPFLLNLDIPLRDLNLENDLTYGNLSTEHSILLSEFKGEDNNSDNQLKKEKFNLINNSLKEVENKVVKYVKGKVGKRIIQLNATNNYDNNDNNNNFIKTSGSIGNKYPFLHPEPNGTPLEEFQDELEKYQSFTELEKERKNLLLLKNYSTDDEPSLTDLKNEKKRRVIEIKMNNIVLKLSGITLNEIEDENNDVGENSYKNDKSNIDEIRKEVEDNNNNNTEKIELIEEEVKMGKEEKINEHLNEREKERFDKEEDLVSAPVDNNNYIKAEEFSELAQREIILRTEIFENFKKESEDNKKLMMDIRNKEKKKEKSIDIRKSKQSVKDNLKHPKDICEEMLSFLLPINEDNDLSKYVALSTIPLIDDCIFRDKFTERQAIKNNLKKMNKEDSKKVEIEKIKLLNLTNELKSKVNEMANVKNKKYNPEDFVIKKLFPKTLLFNDNTNGDDQFNRYDKVSPNELLLLINSNKNFKKFVEKRKQLVLSSIIDDNVDNNDDNYNTNEALSLLDEEIVKCINNVYNVVKDKKRIENGTKNLLIKRDEEIAKRYPFLISKKNPHSLLTPPHHFGEDNFIGRNKDDNSEEIVIDPDIKVPLHLLNITGDKIIKEFYKKLLLIKETEEKNVLLSSTSSSSISDAMVKKEGTNSVGDKIKRYKKAIKNQIVKLSIEKYEKDFSILQKFPLLSIIIENNPGDLYLEHDLIFKSFVAQYDDIVRAEGKEWTGTSASLNSFVNKGDKIEENKENLLSNIENYVREKKEKQLFRDYNIDYISNAFPFLDPVIFIDSIKGENESLVVMELSDENLLRKVTEDCHFLKLIKEYNWNRCNCVDLSVIDKIERAMNDRVYAISKEMVIDDYKGKKGSSRSGDNPVVSSLSSSRSNFARIRGFFSSDSTSKNVNVIEGKTTRKDENDYYTGAFSDLFDAEAKNRRKIKQNKRHEFKTLLTAHFNVSSLILDYELRESSSSDTGRINKRQLKKLQIEERKARALVLEEAARYWSQVLPEMAYETIAEALGVDRCNNYGNRRRDHHARRLNNINESVRDSSTGSFSSENSSFSSYSSHSRSSSSSPVHNRHYSRSPSANSRVIYNENNITNRDFSINNNNSINSNRFEGFNSTVLQLSNNEANMGGQASSPFVLIREVKDGRLISNDDDNDNISSNHVNNNNNISKNNDNNRTRANETRTRIRRVGPGDRNNVNPLVGIDGIGDTVDVPLTHYSPNERQVSLNQRQQQSMTRPQRQRHQIEHHDLLHHQLNQQQQPHDQQRHGVASEKPPPDRKLPPRQGHLSPWQINQLQQEYERYLPINRLISNVDPYYSSRNVSNNNYINNNNSSSSSINYINSPKDVNEGDLYNFENTLVDNYYDRNNIYGGGGINNSSSSNRLDTGKRSYFNNNNVNTNPINNGPNDFYGDIIIHSVGGSDSRNQRQNRGVGGSFSRNFFNDNLTMNCTVTPSRDNSKDNNINRTQGNNIRSISGSIANKARPTSAIYSKSRGNNRNKRYYKD